MSWRSIVWADPPFSSWCLEICFLTTFRYPGILQAILHPFLLILFLAIIHFGKAFVIRFIFVHTWIGERKLNVSWNYRSYHKGAVLDRNQTLQIVSFILLSSNVMMFEMHFNFYAWRRLEGMFKPVLDLKAIGCCCW